MLSTMRKSSSEICSTAPALSRMSVQASTCSGVGIPGPHTFGRSTTFPEQRKPVSVLFRLFALGLPCRALRHARASSTSRVMSKLRTSKQHVSGSNKLLQTSTYWSLDSPGHFMQLPIRSHPSTMAVASRDSAYMPWLTKAPSNRYRCRHSSPTPPRARPSDASKGSSTSSMSMIGRLRLDNPELSGALPTPEVASTSIPSQSVFNEIMPFKVCSPFATTTWKKRLTSNIIAFEQAVRKMQSLLHSAYEAVIEFSSRRLAIHS
mmetsp:Transcript_5781/g.21029  ORF Transcript_5781/g.21029 Transcript_5781/m.21029 type:complete len:263 (+) Transcript_5781:1554-2342(+)